MRVVSLSVHQFVVVLLLDVNMYVYVVPCTDKSLLLNAAPWAGSWVDSCTGLFCCLLLHAIAVLFTSSQSDRGKDPLRDAGCSAGSRSS